MWRPDDPGLRGNRYASDCARKMMMTLFLLPYGDIFSLLDCARRDEYLTGVGA
jgi:hypothetical protein